jgi:Cytochrome c7 and related cytochrome c/Cytochrome c3
LKIRGRLRLSCLGALLAALALYAAPAGATQIERLLMPGEVSTAHAKLEADCQKCHDRTDSDRQTVLCLDCHKEIAADLKQTRGFHGHTFKPGAKCNACHTEHKGRNGDVVRFDRAAFDHTQTGYLLDGRHATTPCAACHVAGKKMREAPITCFGCHEKVDQHKGKLGKECQDCHTTTSWPKTKFDHDKTRFPLKGAHIRTACADCHADPTYKNAPRECIACHARDDAHKGTRGPGCGDCHNEVKWKDSSFDHLKVGKFALNGAHAKITCDACHRSGDMKVKIPDKCAGCHAADDHHGGRFGDSCGDCHSELKWTDAKYDHADPQKANWPLRGKHEKVACEQCHTTPVGKPKLATDCIGCHKADDVHRGSMGDKCASCHVETGWKDKVRFDHDMTRFPLVGLHANVACEECHPNRVYRNTVGACISCHKADDVHHGHLGKECADCHNPNGWKFWQFDHGKATKFALEGAHAKIECKACHIKPPDEVKPPTDCSGCHARDDIHQGGFGRDCGRCHSSISWRGAGVRR